MSSTIFQTASRIGAFPIAFMAAAVLMAGPAAADPEFDFQVGVASEYVGKGLGKSNGEIAWSGQVGVSQGDFRATVFASTAELSSGADSEIITTLGWAPEAFGFEWDFSVMNRDLPGTAAGIDSNYWEYQADVSRSIGPVSARVRVNYTPDGFSGTEEAWWVEAQGAYKITGSTKASAAIATRRAHGGADYTAWNIGVKHKLTDAIAADIRWYDTDEHDLGDNYDGRLVGALTFAF
ncbi:TorF family putative porin [Brevundimonas sp. FT23042]|uniref:TorF family putative porin n=1 Tax=Brevundimonas sp. FT23042 TaxID=3393749 RepID=UPI003B5888AD